MESNFDVSDYENGNVGCDSGHLDSGLAHLRSLNEDEMSADWFNFQVKLWNFRISRVFEVFFMKKNLQEAVSNLQALEEDLTDSHRNVIGNMKQWVKDDSQLLEVTNKVDYDQDCKFLDFIFI